MPKCLKCNDSIIEVKELRFSSSIKRRTVDVIVPCNVCQNCQTPLMNNEQMNTMRKVVVDRYREMENLLTSKDIIAYREKLGLSQIGFARFLNVGEASIKRWETYYIQDEGQDDHIRIKCDSTYSESHAFYLQSQYGDDDIYSGLKGFSAPLIREVSQWFERLHPDCATYLRKLHFYADFLHFKRHNRCITGMRYVPLKSGPSPHNYNQIAQFVQNRPPDSPKTKSFDDHEKRTLDDVCNLFLQDNGQKICELSLLERGFLETQDAEFISYGYAQHLLI